MNLNEIEWKRFLKFDEIPKDRHEYYSDYYRKNYENYLFAPVGWKGAYCLHEFERANKADDVFIRRDYGGEAITIQVSPCGTMYRLINE